VIAMARPRYGTVLNGALRPWQAPQLPAWFTPVLSCLLACSALGRGLDLVLFPPPPAPPTARGSREIVAWVDVFGQQHWGGALALAGASVLITVLVPALRRNGAVLAAHALAGAVTVAYAFALLGGWASAGEGGGFRFGIVAAAAGAVWVALSLAHITLVVRALAADPVVDLPPASERRCQTRRAADRRGHQEC